MDDDGLLVTHSAYDALGQLMAGENATPYGYKGHWGYYTDSETCIGCIATAVGHAWAGALLRVGGGALVPVVTW